MYLALYRKWRPAKFSDVVGQEHITNTLKNELVHDKTAHAYLFTGSRGTGKTTCAKIFAKAVNCLNLKEGEPCGECEVCNGVDNGSVTDVVEIDAASNSGVDDIRELREMAYYTPAFAKYRVYIIDEVHMLSNEAFNALLKIMEEPPEHVKFILATTEAHKVPITILSRCQRFDFKRIKTEDIKNRLLYIAENENVTLDANAAALIARLADGGLRDAISLLDQVLAATDNVTVQTVTDSIGVAGSEYLFKLADSIAQHDSATALKIIDELYMNAKDLQRLCSELINHFRNLMLAKAINNCETIINAMSEEIEDLKKQQTKFSMDEIINAADALQECGDRITRAAGKRIEFEMCMIRLCGQTASVKKEEKPVEVKKDRIATVPQLVKQEPIAKELPKLPEKEPVPIEENIPLPEETPIDVREFDSPVEAPPVTESQESNAAANDNSWKLIVAELGKTAPHLYGVLANAMGHFKDDSVYILSSSPMLSALLRRDGNIKYLKEAVLKITGTDYKIKLKASKPQNDESEPQNKLIENAKKLGIKIDIE